MNKIDFKDLPDTTTPFTASIFNELQDNVEEGIINANTYSTNETIIGKWLNKPLYRKIVANNVNISNHSTIIDINSLNIEEIINIGSINKNNSNIFINNYYDNLSDKLNIFVEGNTISVWSDEKTYTSTIWIEYTKTTDIVE